MHSITGPRGTIFHFNGDGSGDVLIRRGSDQEFEIPAKDLVCFVAELVRRARESKLGDMSDAEILGLKEQD